MPDPDSHPTLADPMPPTVVLPPGGMTPPGADDQPTVVTPVRPLPAIDGYELAERVGRGGFADVYRATQLALDRTVAVKVIDPAAGGDPQVLARVRTEAVALARFQHPNIVPVYDYGQAGGRMFIVMELLVGEDLGRRLARGGRLDERTAWLIVRQAAAGLAHAAAHGVVHRDVKPGNLFLVPPQAGAALPAGVPQVKVTDFGLARARWAVDESDQPVTAPGASLGTPAYMAPEQHEGSAAVDHRADIYALGATAFHALSGRPPFAGGTIWEVMARKLENAAPPLAGVSAETAELVAAMMAARPADRVADYDELLARIDALPAVSGAGPTARLRRRRSRRRWLLPLGLTLLGLVAAGAWAARRPSAGAAVRYVPADDPLPLYNRRSLDNWTADGGGLGSVEDDEKLTVLEVGRRAKLRLRPYPDYQLAVGLDVRAATAAEVRVGRAGGPLFAVRVESAGGAMFGRRDTPDAEFRPLGERVAVPAVSPSARPYREVRIERTGGGWAAWYDNVPLGRTADPTPPDPLAWVAAEGGPVRVDAAELTPLRAER